MNTISCWVSVVGILFLSYSYNSPMVVWFYVKINAIPVYHDFDVAKILGLCETLSNGWNIAIYPDK